MANQKAGLSTGGRSTWETRAAFPIGRKKRNARVSESLKTQKERTASPSSRGVLGRPSRMMRKYHVRF
uniref:Uncharacterized protein n=1 Tax=Monomastix sp. (strain OKE-1) TaxID=141716 RepID=U5YDQ1_MONSK|nr:hypothetical protein [Monomastix sp. OKE-1]AGZ90209.1 hypothetical protein [Monomastix sp. OKE-1]